jgi:hypothetical protein
MAGEKKTGRENENSKHWQSSGLDPFVLEHWDGQLDVLALSFVIGFEGASSSSVGLVAFRIYMLGCDAMSVGTDIMKGLQCLYLQGQAVKASGMPDSRTKHCTMDRITFTTHLHDIICMYFPPTPSHSQL